MKIQFRAYKTKDRETCWNMMVSTWQYDLYFPSIKNIDHLYRLVFDMYRLHSDYLEVALKLPDDKPAKEAEPIGFLFGQTKPATLTQKLRYTLFSLKITLLWIFGYYGNRKLARTVFQTYTTDTKALLQDCTPSDAHIHSFFTSDTARGYGVGTSLLERFTTHCKNNQNKRIILMTDTDCNYGFYDHIGFVRIKEKSGCLGVPQTDTAKSKSLIFVYAKILI